MDEPTNYSELLRAKQLADKLHSAILLAKHFKQAKVKLDLADAEELTQLLFDSLRTIEGIEDIPEPTQQTRLIPQLNGVP